MPTQDPIARIKDDRVQARRLEDSGADICFLALADEAGRASVRTLVLREIRDNCFLLFINRSSPKWQILEAGGDYELLLWYQSMQRQYRVRGTTRECDVKFVRQSWQRRPRGSKYLDILYATTVDQSTEIESRDALVGHINSIKGAHDVENMEAPDKVAGIELVASSIELLDLNREDRIHDRQRYDLIDGQWRPTTLVP